MFANVIWLPRTTPGNTFVPGVRVWGSSMSSRALRIAGGGVHNPARGRSAEGHRKISRTGRSRIASPASQDKIADSFGDSSRPHHSRGPSTGETNKWSSYLGGKREGSQKHQGNG